MLENKSSGVDGDEITMATRIMFISDWFGVLDVDAYCVLRRLSFTLRTERKDCCG
jgi:hypothetical protein